MTFTQAALEQRPYRLLGFGVTNHETRITNHGLFPACFDRRVVRNAGWRLFRRLKGFRRIFSRFDKLDVMFLAFLHFALIVEALS